MSEWEISQLEARVKRIEAWMRMVQGQDKPKPEAKPEEEPTFIDPDDDSLPARIRRSQGLELQGRDEE